MSKVWDKKFRLTLWGVDMEPLALSRPRKCREGLFLSEVPDGLQGFDKRHLWDEASGSWHGMSTDTNQIKLEVIAKGCDVRRYMDRLLTALGDGSHPIGLSVVSAEWGYRWYRMRVASVSQIDWGQSPGGSHFAKCSVILEFAGDTTRRFKERVTLAKDSKFGRVEFRVDGDQPVWPKFTVTGSHGGVRLRLTAQDEWQTVPYRAGGWVIDSHPARRHVTDIDGKPDFSQIVPFWPEPVPVIKSTATVEIEVMRPGSDFQLHIDYVPEFSRAW